MPEAELLNSGGHLYCDVDIPRHSPYDNHYKLLLHLRLGLLFCKEAKGQTRLKRSKSSQFVCQPTENSDFDNSYYSTCINDIRGS